MTKDEFLKIRKRLKKTQKDISTLLGVSQKSVESYEQGLRNIPVNIQRILYFLLFKLNMNKFGKKRLCWEQKDCPSEIRNNCVAWIANEGFFCWFITGKLCIFEKKKLTESTENCFNCSFFKRNLKKI